MGKRTQPLLLSISHRDRQHSGIGRQLWNYAQRILEGMQQDERLFAVIYTIDESDDPWERRELGSRPTHRWGQAVQPEAIRSIMRQARNNPAQEAAAKTTPSQRLGWCE